MRIVVENGRAVRRPVRPISPQRTESPPPFVPETPADDPLVFGSDEEIGDAFVEIDDFDFDAALRRNDDSQPWSTLHT